MYSYLRQLSWSIVFRVGSLILSYVSVSLVFKSLGEDEYGVWSVLLSIATWVFFLDLGIVNGTRNEITKALEGNVDKIGTIVATSYFAVTITSVLLALLLLVIEVVAGRDFVRSLIPVELKVFLVFFLLLLSNMALSVIKAIFFSHHKADLVLLIQFLHNAIFVFIIYVSIELVGEIELFGVVALNGLVLVAVQLTLSCSFYAKNKVYRPAFRLIESKYIRKLVNVGGVFFVIQLSAIVLLSTDRLLILNLNGAGAAARYDLLYRLFNVCNVVGGVFLAPLWAAFSAAKQGGQYVWMKRKLNILVYSFSVVVISVFIFTFFVEFIVSHWVGPQVKFLSIEIFIVALFVVVLYWSSIFSTFCNGCGLLKMQLCCSVVAAIVNIPLSIYMVKGLGFGMEGVVLSSILGLALFSIAGPITSYAWLNKKLERNHAC